MTLTVLNVTVRRVTDELSVSAGLRVITPGDWGDDLGWVAGGTWREIIGARLGARRRSMFAVQLGAASTTRQLSHVGEAVYYVIEGRVAVVEQLQDRTARHELDLGGMVHVAPGALYWFESADGARLVGGPAPVDRLPPVIPPAVGTTPRVSVHHQDRPGLKVPLISRDARLVVWLGSGARTANMNYVVLEPGERNKEHVHAESEDTIHILEGHGTAENVSTGESFGFGPGDTIHIEIGTWHAIAADRDERVVSVGGPCPADLDMLRAAGVDVEGLLPHQADGS